MAGTIRSMTGYGSGSAKVPGGRITVEVRSVNQRFLDLNIKGPREYLLLERRLAPHVRKGVRRGKVDVFVNKTVDATDPQAVRVDAELARGYRTAFTELARILDTDAEPSLELVANQRGVLVVGGLTPDPESDADGVEEAVIEAVGSLVEMRETEGDRLARDVLENNHTLRELTERLAARAPQVTETYRQNLEQRLAELLGDASMDEARLAQEVALLAERTDIHEEIVRLRSHLEQLEAFVQDGGEVGRRLDFLLQEVYREINTAGSKAQDAEASRIVVDMKGVAERLREQAQNIE